MYMINVLDPHIQCNRNILLQIIENKTICILSPYKIELNKSSWVWRPISHQLLGISVCNQMDSFDRWWLRIHRIRRAEVAYGGLRSWDVVVEWHVVHATTAAASNGAALPHYWWCDLQIRIYWNKYLVLPWSQYIQMKAKIA